MTDNASTRVRRTAVRVAAALLAGTTVLAVAPAAWATGAPVDRPAAAEEARPDGAALRKALDALVSEGGSSAALGEVRDHGRVVWRGAAGTGDLDTGSPARADGRFRIGSVTKTFVSTVVLQLVGEGRVGLDDPVERYLPGAVRGGDTITVRQLLNHTSGLYSYTDEPGFFFEDEATLRSWLDERRWTTYRPQQLVDIANRHEPYFPPGQGWRYSNTNYVLAGMLVEKVTGRSWNQEVERRIIRPLGLAHTSMPDTATTVPGVHAHGYLKLPSGGRADVTELNPTMAGSAGAGISTTDDLARFNAALLGGRLLRPAQLAEMKTTVDVGQGFGYGLGLMKYPAPCGEFWGHGGGIPGYETMILGDAQGRRQVALSQNPFEEAAPETGQRVTNAFLLGAACPGSGTGGAQVPQLGENPASLR
ncbi:serine hydrolase domain-containing protein [Kitasatospora camelliae]|uniref:Serine hydrolase domain-containing protein n=1 Tax=Kitasatospora camelliae TaxID=3156397 RepID=A0AAU8K3I7_9ACTN